SRTSFATFLPSLSLRLDLTFETIDAVANAAPIRFEFCFAGASSADAAGQPRKRRILTGDQSRQQILELGQLDLNLSFSRLCALREDVENQLRSVDDFEIRSF